MEKLNIIDLVILTLSALLMTMVIVPAMAAPATIDGDLHDWGLDELYTAANWGTEASWVPDSTAAYFTVEDNKYKDYKNNWNHGDDQWYVGDSSIGVHIKRDVGTVGSHVEYIEGKTGTWIQPAGGEIVDLEALYVDSTPDMIYFALIHSIRGNDSESPENYMGDLAITVGSGTYGIVLNRANKGAVYKNPSWKLTGEAPRPVSTWVPIDSNKPWRVIADETKYMGMGSVMWSSDANALPQDNYHEYRENVHSGPNYVIEGAIPASYLGNPSSGDLTGYCWCYNDVIELPKVNFEIPEFATIAIPVGMILGLFYLFRRKRKSKGE